MRPEDISHTSLVLLERDLWRGRNYLTMFRMMITGEGPNDCDHTLEPFVMSLYIYLFLPNQSRFVFRLGIHCLEEPSSLRRSKILAIYFLGQIYLLHYPPASHFEAS